jgi:hypothetical protein
LPFDAIAQITRPNDTQHAALDELRSSVAATVNKLTSECPREISTPFSAQLDNVIQGIDTTVAGLDAVRRPCKTSMARSKTSKRLGSLCAAGLRLRQAQVQERSSQSERWRVFNGGPASTSHPLGAVCEQLTASLRDWPIRQMESDMGLSDPQRIALYELAIASLKASNMLACPAEGALTPAGRLDTMRLRLSAMRAAVSAVRPALLHFYEVLNERQKQRFAQM